ncbi:cytochrome P450 1A1-like, partial [Littorina saxatilis]|uniref:cytochrome P450 1A1-like n=1 Tax=Littorina saxatilis TaxID=31220 RepID=UPI0038B5A7A1
MSSHPISGSPNVTMATQHVDDQSESLIHRLAHSLCTPFSDWITLDPIKSVVTEYPAALGSVALLLSSYLLLRHWRNRKLPPGPWAWPVIGHLNYLLTNPHFKLSHFRDVYGDVYQLQCGGRRVVVVNSLEGIMQGLVERGDDVSDRPDLESYNVLYPTSRQQGVVTGDVSEAWRAKKQFLSEVIDTYCSHAARIQDKVSAEIVDTVNLISDIRDPFDPSPVLHMACLNVALNLTFSQRFDPVGRLAQELYKTYDCRSSMFAFNAVDFQRLLKVFTTDDHHNYIQQQTERQIDCNRRLLNWHKDTYDPASLRDFTDQLLLYVESGEDSGLLTKDDLDHILLDLAGSGFQATAVTLTWLLGYMALNQDVQGEVHKEIDAVVGRDRLPSLEDQPYLPLTEAVMCEVQRLASVRPFLIPHRTRKGTVIQGYDIPRDTLVL